MTTFDPRGDAGAEPLSPWDPVPDVVDGLGPSTGATTDPGEEQLPDGPSGPSAGGPRRRRRHVGRLIAVLVVATVLGLLVADVLIGRLAFTTRQDHWASAFNDPTVARPDRGAPSMVLQVEDLEVNVVVAEGSAADIVRGGPGLMGGSPLPGEPGNAVIVGRSSRFGAPFAFVEDVGEGTVVVVRQKAGQVARFEVTDVEVVGEDEFEAVVGEGVPADGAGEDDPSTLTLVTSAGGPFDSRRRVARAELTGLSPAGAVAVAATGDESTDSTTTTVSDGDPAADPSGESEEVEVAEDASVSRDPGRRPGGFDVRSPSVVLTLVGGLLVVVLAAAAIPELRRRHSTATVVVVAAPAVALGLVLMLMSLDAILPVTY